MTRVATPENEAALLQVALDSTSPEPVSQKRADALARVVEGFLAGAGRGQPGTSVPEWHGEQMDNGVAVDIMMSTCTSWRMLSISSSHHSSQAE